MARAHGADELPAAVVVPHDTLHLGVEVAVGEADDEALGGEKDTPHYLKYILRPGYVGRTLDGDEVANAQDWHHYDQRLTTHITSDLPYFNVFTFAAFQCFLS